MKKWALLLVVACMIPFTLNAAPSIIGTWENLKDLPNYPGSKDGHIFEANGNYTYNGPGAFTARWKQTGTTITLTFEGGSDTSTMKIIQLTGDRLTIQIDSQKPASYRRIGGSPDSRNSDTAESGYVVNDRVMVKWNDEWYPAVILKVKGKKYLIHYDGYESSWDEWVGTDRIKR